MSGKNTQQAEKQIYVGSGNCLTLSINDGKIGFSVPVTVTETTGRGIKQADLVTRLKVPAGDSYKNGQVWLLDDDRSIVYSDQTEQADQATPDFGSEIERALWILAHTESDQATVYTPHSEFKSLMHDKRWRPRLGHQAEKNTEIKYETCVKYLYLLALNPAVVYHIRQGVISGSVIWELRKHDDSIQLDFLHRVLAGNIPASKQKKLLATIANPDVTLNNPPGDIIPLWDEHGFNFYTAIVPTAIGLEKAERESDLHKFAIFEQKQKLEKRELTVQAERDQDKQIESLEGESTLGTIERLEQEKKQADSLIEAIESDPDLGTIEHIEDETDESIWLALSELNQSRRAVKQTATEQGKKQTRQTAIAVDVHNMGFPRMNRSSYVDQNYYNAMRKEVKRHRQQARAIAQAIAAD